MRVIIVQLRGQQKRRHQILLKQFKLIFFRMIPINLLCQILDSINLWFAPSHIKHHFPTWGHGAETRGDHRIGDHAIIFSPVLLYKMLQMPHRSKKEV